LPHKIPENTKHQDRVGTFQEYRPNIRLSCRHTSTVHAIGTSGRATNEERKRLFAAGEDLCSRGAEAVILGAALVRLSI
jgi:hypothetical protein